MNKNKILIWLIIIVISSLIIYLLLPKNNNNELTKRSDYYHNYEENEVQNIIVSLEEVADKYLADLVNDIIFFPEDVYNKIDDNTKIKYQSFDEFKSYLNNLKTKDFLNAEVKSYSRILIDNKNAIYVIDSENNEIIFIENSINDYKVRIN